MKHSVIELLESTAVRFPERTAYFDNEQSYTFSELRQITRSIGTVIGRLNEAESGEGNDSGSSAVSNGMPVAVLMSKGVSMVAAFIGAVSGGACYCPIDVTMPAERMKAILSVLQPKAVITERGQEELIGQLDIHSPVFQFDEISKTEEDAVLLEKILERATENDPLYILFTSGSTGIPKGVVVPHRVVLNNMEWLEERYGFNETDVLANQAPLYFDVSDHDVYCPLKFGCSTGIVPPEFFTFPVKLISYLKEHNVTAIFWVPFALSVISSLRGFEVDVPDKLRFIFFAGEVMPMKHLNYWRRHLPNAVYSNMYGPTETYVCTYYDVDREFADSETLPIGFPCGNVELVVIGDGGKEITPGMIGAEGELCVKGCTLALGYYNDPERTAERFTQNPFNNEPELIYHTGDVVSYNELGELLYHDRMDFQIKRLGYRIELGEIEAAAGEITEIEDCACIYNINKQTILFCYTGTEMEKAVLKEKMKNRLPHYMLPNKYIYLDDMPRNANGKIDRKKLKELYIK